MTPATQVDLSGQTALVTGGSRGIGRAIAVALGQAGARVGINYVRNRAAAEATAQEIIARGGPEPLVIKANVGEEEQVARLFAELGEKFGGLDILVSNAATGVLKPAKEIPGKYLAWTLKMSAEALLLLVQRALPLMQGRRGRIIAVSSLGATRAIPYYMAMGAAKAALESIVRHLALELGPSGIRINIVSPGVVDTEALRHFPNREQMLTYCEKTTPLGRLVTPEDVARVVLLLVSELAEMIHGQRIVVDGGYSIVAWP